MHLCFYWAKLPYKGQKIPLRVFSPGSKYCHLINKTSWYNFNFIYRWFLSHLHLPLVVEIHSIDDLFLSVLHYFPYSATDHVTRRKWGDGQTVTFSCSLINYDKFPRFWIGVFSFCTRVNEDTFSHLSGWRSESISAAGFCQKLNRRHPVWTERNLLCCVETIRSNKMKQLIFHHCLKAKVSNTRKQCFALFFNWGI